MTHAVSVGCPFTFAKGATSTPKTSRLPVAVTPVATTTAMLVTCPPAAALRRTCR
jgi:hypothetical protein